MIALSIGDMLPCASAAVLLFWGFLDLWKYKQNRDRAILRDALLLLVLGILDAFGYAYQRRADQAMQNKVNSEIERNNALAKKVTSYNAEISSLKSKVIESQKQTIANQDKLLAATQENSANITGGESYPTVLIVGRDIPPEANSLPLMIMVTGKNALYDVSLEILEGAPPYRQDVNYTKFQKYWGTLVPNVVLGLGYNLPVSPTGTTSCLIKFVARNGLTFEWLEFRLAYKQLWQYRVKSSRKGDYAGTRWSMWIPTSP